MGIQTQVKFGSVNWFNAPKGFGFILQDDDGADLFVHQSNIRMEGFRTLDAGQRVSFEVEHDVERGKSHAVNVFVVEGERAGE